MNSLFTKIFLTFWLSAVLLGSTLLGISRLLGSEVIANAEQSLLAKAETAAALWEEGDQIATVRWLRSQPENLRLLNAAGEALGRHQRARPMQHTPHPPRPGVHSVGDGRVIITAPLPGIEPKIFLAQELRTGHLALTPWWLRIVLAVLITGLLSYLLAALLTRRLRRLRTAAQALAAGDLSVRIGRPGGDEVEALARDFDQMTDHLRELLNTQKRLLRDVSHELRSPLARLRIALELAERDPQKSLPRIAKEADELEALIRNVLSLARLESGQNRLERSIIDLRELLQQVVTDANFEAGAKQRAVRLLPGGNATLFAAPMVLKSAVENIIRNALQHTPQESTVEVDLQVESSAACLEIRDQGPGIPEADLEHIFEPFTRVGEARERSRGGYGLGLAISARAIHLFGGRILAENHPQGGLRVRIQLPLS